MRNRCRRQFTGDRSSIVRMVSRAWIAFFVLGILTCFSAAQSGATGYVVGGFGAVTNGEDSSGTLHLGGGVEVIANGGFGVGAEIGYVAPFESFSDGMGNFSAGALYAFKPGNKTVPFLEGGYSLLFREGTASGIYFGGGVNHWFGERWGIRIEGRDHVNLQGETFHILEARFGLSFR